MSRSYYLVLVGQDSTIYGINYIQSISHISRHMKSQHIYDHEDETVSCFQLKFLTFRYQFNY